MPKIRRKYGENTEGSTRVKLEPIRRLGGAPETPNRLDVGVHKPRTRRRRRRAQLPAPVQGLSRLTLHVGSHLCWLDVDPQRSPGVAAASAGGARRCSATRAHAERISCGPTPHRHGGGAACSHGRGRGRRGHPSGSLHGARGRVHLRVPIKIWPLARSLLVRRWRPFPRLSSSSRALLGTQLSRARGPRRGRGMIVARN